MFESLGITPLRETALKARFRQQNIPYNDIDPEMIELIDILNFRVSYKTDCCCIGHEEIHEHALSEVIFSESVSDEDIKRMISNFSKCVIEESVNPSTLDKYVCFKKWARIDHMCNGEYLQNWIMEFPVTNGFLWNDFFEYKRNVMKAICDTLKNGMD